MQSTVKRKSILTELLAVSLSNIPPRKNAEPFYYLGVALKGQGRFDEAYTAFYKATWKEEWKSPGYFSIAEIAAMKGDFKSSLNFVNRALDANSYNVSAYGLKSSVLRHLNRADEAIKLVSFAKEKCDPLDVHLMAEQWLLTKDPDIARTLFGTMNTFPATALETAAAYFSCGLWSDGSVLLKQTVTAAPTKQKFLLWFIIISDIFLKN